MSLLLKCDRCGKMATFSQGTDWLTVAKRRINVFSASEESRYQTFHFCSAECVKQWAAREKLKKPEPPMPIG